MILFVIDACGLGRIYFEDIGTRNLLMIYNYPNSQTVVPNIAHCEALSTMISARNGQLIDEAEYMTCRSQLAQDFDSGKFRVADIDIGMITLARDLLHKHKTVAGKMALGGVDSVYLALAVRLSGMSSRFGLRTILVTSDKALYNSALDEPGLEAFHFWTCDLGCGCTSIIPVKGQANSCPQCGQTCALCRIDLCPSTHQVAF